MTDVPDGRQRNVYRVPHAFGYDNLGWVLIKTPIDRTCFLCHQRVFKKSQMFRPLTNTGRRQDRICLSCAVKITRPAGDSDPVRVESLD